MLRRLALSLIVLPACLAVPAQTVPDSVRVVNIDEVGVTAGRVARRLRSAMPVQVLDGASLRRLGALQLSDAVKMMNGVAVKDYGGIGGLKTVSVRSLGAAHTGVTYDGVPVTDAQTGQIDLGRFTLDGVAAVTLSDGQDDDIFRPARQFASASVLTVTTSRPEFDGKDVNVSASLKGGSFGLVNPALRLEGRIGGRMALAVSGDYMHVRGDYPYRQDNGDATVTRHRDNSDVGSWHVEADLFGHFDGGRELHAKAYYYASSRGLPTNILYNDYAGQRLWDRNFFVQGRYSRKYGRDWSLSATVKWNRSYNRYYDPSVYNSRGYDDDRYKQDEGYLSAVAMWRPLPVLSFSLATDGIVNAMNATLDGFAVPVRYTMLNVLAGRLVLDRLTLTVSVLSTATRETVHRGQAAPGRHRFSPAAALSVKPFARSDLRIRLMYKDVFRLPTFNDLYYGTVGTRTLRPEQAMQLSGGMTWYKQLGGRMGYVSATADAFYNRVTDKIVAVPTKNLFIWSMMNIGRVDIKGVETSVETSLDWPCGVGFTLSAGYTWQRALDKTDRAVMPYKATFNHQIPYTPRHSGSVRCDVRLPWLTLGWTAVVSGVRYCNQYNAADYRLGGYNDHTLTASRDFTLRGTCIRVQVEVLNVGGKNYEVVKNYPMPGRQYRLGVVFEY